MVKNELYIRRATPEDAGLLSELSSITFFDTFNGTCTAEDLSGFIEDCFNVKILSRELQDQDDFYFIAFVNGHPAGYMRLKEGISNVEIIDKYRAIELKRIYVLKQYHSQKVGAGLMDFALDFARTNNYELMWLGVWEHNERAKNFYHKFGFEDSGETHDFPIGQTPQTDHWFFKLIINP